MKNTIRFKIHIYSPKSGHNDLYSFTKTKAGWKFENYRCKGEVDKGGNPLFYKTLNAESISNPDHLASCISEVWEQAETLDEKQIQLVFDELSRMNL